jgi:AcrR family transcriptional regulator
MTQSKAKPASTRNRLLQAATEVFSHYGINGATTREIARVAQVNEVTLFRHFQCKEQLLIAVVEQATALQMEFLSNQSEWTHDLQTDLTHYAQLYNQMLEEYEAFIRTFIGEAKRHPEVAQQVLSTATQPVREKLVHYLQNNIDQGEIRSTIEPKIAVDLFTGMLLAGMLRRTAMPEIVGYGKDAYIAHCVDLFVQGISIT